jgi:transposase
METLTELYCLVDDFYQAYERTREARQLGDGKKRRGRKAVMSLSEQATILILFHQSRYRDFKSFYTKHVEEHLRVEFPDRLSYGRFIQRLPEVRDLLAVFLQSLFGPCTGISFIDSTPLAVCDIHRAANHRVFAQLAARGKTSMGWFFGFKLHLVVNDRGQLLSLRVTPGNTHDTKPVLSLTEGLFGKLFGDKGYLGRPLQEQLRTRNIHLITPIRNNMKNRLVVMSDKLLLRKRVLIEAIIDQLKNVSRIEHTRHRSPASFAVHLLSGLIAYSLQPKKPSLSWHHVNLAYAAIS